MRGRYAKTHSGQITLFTEEHGHAPLLGQLLKLRAYADYSTEFKASTEAPTELIEEAAAFVERCRALVAHALESGPTRPIPHPTTESAPALPRRRCGLARSSPGAGCPR